jgi:tRNA pseudouridine13 synthase
MEKSMSYLTVDIPGTGGVIKESPEDFIVEEVPLYLPCGEGEHVYAVIEKRGITTLEAICRIARSLGTAERDIGYAGMKDAVGITRQTISIPRVLPGSIAALDLPRVTVLSVALHRNKLRLGHLAGNRFRIRVRDIGEGGLEKAEAVLELLGKRGVPNRFGPQRYGAQGNSHLVGRALVRRDYRAAVDHIIGDPATVRDDRWREAIEAYRRGEIGESIRLFPGHCRTERAILQRLASRPDGHEKALHAVHPRLKKLYLSALQSALFDRLLEARLSNLDRVMEGDLAWKHDNGACFLVTDAAAEAVRAESFEISPTGPLVGFRMRFPEGEPRLMEEALLVAEGLTPESFNLPGGLAMEGDRRPLRVPLGEPRVVQDGEGLILSFTLPRGAYATSVLSEIMKNEL